MDHDFPLHNFLKPTQPNNIKTNDYKDLDLNSKPKNDIPQKEINEKQQRSFSDSELHEINSEILNCVKNLLPQEKFETFFVGNLHIKNITREEIQFAVTSNFIRKMIQDYYCTQLESSIEYVLGKKYKIALFTHSKPQPPGQSTNEVELVSEEDAKPAGYTIHKANSVKEMTFSINDLKPLNDDLEAKVQSRVIDYTDSASGSSGQAIDNKKTFDNFVVGPSNNLAHASAIAVSKNPGNVYSSLYFHGNSGLGKTHLLHAVANHIQEVQPSLKIYITTANDFMSEMINAIQAQNIQSFRKKYSEYVDVLMIDDIHELKNKPGTQNEFFHVFNELQRRKKQLIFTSDKDPKEITGIEDRIRTRLSSALVVEIQQPDFETRIAILKKKAMEEDIYLPDDVVNLIASCIKSNIRELEGSLIKLGAYSSVFNVDIDLETAKEQLKLNVEDEKKTVNMETITKTVSSYYKIPVPDIRSKARNKEITLARHVSMYFSYYIAKATLMEIGDYFGKRDHTSVMHGVNKIKMLQKTNQEFSQKLYEIESMF
ncbi:MAG: chromosomal replication initiator protein DnaA [Halobacteriovoraceae bacterium]|nr:chromosomal replication initiator protein DnaA [Halobacteriovoraceae bacterium]